MRSLAELMSVYQRHHHKTITKLTHFIGVPIIVLAIAILLAMINPYLAWSAGIVLLIYYAALDITLSIITAIFLLPIIWYATHFTQYHPSISPMIAFITLFIFGWAAQFIGHYFEGNRPAFMENLFQVFVAPIFLVAEIVFLLGFKKALQKKISQLITSF
jgi:uncharacterized membrane protein YGL010W